MNLTKLIALFGLLGLAMCISHNLKLKSEVISTQPIFDINNGIYEKREGSNGIIIRRLL